MLYNRECFVWVDETGSDKRKAMRKFGYSFRGTPPVYHRFLVRGKRISAIAAIVLRDYLELNLPLDLLMGISLLILSEAL